jgi:hypothetical protein
VNPYEATGAPLEVETRAVSATSRQGLAAFVLAMLAVGLAAMPIGYFVTRGRGTVEAGGGFVIGLALVLACMSSSASFALGIASLFQPAQRRTLTTIALVVSGLFLFAMLVAVIGAGWRTYS